MKIDKITEIVENSSEAAFATNDMGEIVAWNSNAEKIFGISAAEVIGKACDEVVNGISDCGPVCTIDCAVQKAAREHCQICNFQMEISTKQGRQPARMSVLIVNIPNNPMPYSVHTVNLINKI